MEVVKFKRKFQSLYIKYLLLLGEWKIKMVKWKIDRDAESWFHVRS